MPSLRQLYARQCAYHSGNTSGSTYDSNGKLCASMTTEEKNALIGALSLCGAVLIVLAVIYGRRYWKKKRLLNATTKTFRPTSCVDAPLISPFGNIPALSPSLSVYTSDSDNKSIISTPSQSQHSHSSEKFHFPILSADGFLLPPPPASIRQSPAQAYYGDDRPLPSPPSSGEAAIFAPQPKAVQAWKYAPVVSESSCHQDELYGVRSLGLYESSEEDVGPMEMTSGENEV